MGHLIDESKGFPAFVAVGEPGWHGLGNVKKAGTILTAEQALQDGGLDFTVLKLPNIHLLPNGQEIVSDNSFFTVRTDTNAVLGDKLGPVYKVLQNVEALNVVNDILDSGKAVIETAGSIDGGKKVFICLKVVKSIIIGGKDVINQYILIATSHDGSISITVTPTNIRVVCNNTMTAALRSAMGAIKLRHTITAPERLKEAAKILNLIDTNTDVNTENYSIMKDTIITKEQMFDYFGNVFMTGEEIKALQDGKKANDVLSTRKANILADVLNYSMTGVGQDLALTGGNLNMWLAYNAVTGYVTRKKYKSYSDRADSLLFGTAAETIHDAGVLAMTPEKIKRLSNKTFGSINFN